METTLDRFGRIVIPKQIRDDLGLRPGSVLDLEERQGEIVLKPVHSDPHVVLREGVLVFTGTVVGEISQVVRAHREEHLEKVSGLKRR